MQVALSKIDVILSEAFEEREVEGSAFSLRQETI